MRKIFFMDLEGKLLFYLNVKFSHNLNSFFHSNLAMKRILIDVVHIWRKVSSTLITLMEHLVEEYIPVVNSCLDGLSKMDCLMDMEKMENNQDYLSAGNIERLKMKLNVMTSKLITLRKILILIHTFCQVKKQSLKCNN